jgi:hypothetical protein
MTKEELENYEPKGDLTGFPKEIINRMLDCQEEQGNKKDISVFENNIRASIYDNGFAWEKTKEKHDFWDKVITEKNFDVFFEKYPKQDNQYNSQEFKLGDEVIDIIRGRRGKIIDINTLIKDSYPISAEFNDNEVISFTLDGRDYNSDKYPRLLHYRDDYDYSVIDFNNLPKRQEDKRWRAEKGKRYYYISSGGKAEDFIEKNDFFDKSYFNSGNYFQTKEEAQKIADKLKEYFNQLINK